MVAADAALAVSVVASLVAAQREALIASFGLVQMLDALAGFEMVESAAAAAVAAVAAVAAAVAAAAAVAEGAVGVVEESAEGCCAESVGTVEELLGEG
jgi:hypothetical protein